MTIKSLWVSAAALLASMWVTVTWGGCTAPSCPAYFVGDDFLPAQAGTNFMHTMDSLPKKDPYNIYCDFFLENKDADLANHVYVKLFLFDVSQALYTLNGEHINPDQNGRLWVTFPGHKVSRLMISNVYLQDGNTDVPIISVF